MFPIECNSNSGCAYNLLPSQLGNCAGFPIDPDGNIIPAPELPTLDPDHGWEPYGHGTPTTPQVRLQERFQKLAGIKKKKQ